jgi:hypothetical protein
MCQDITDITHFQVGRACHILGFHSPECGRDITYSHSTLGGVWQAVPRQHNMMSSIFSWTVYSLKPPPCSNSAPCLRPHLAWTGLMMTRPGQAISERHYHIFDLDEGGAKKTVLGVSAWCNVSIRFPIKLLVLTWENTFFQISPFSIQLYQ